jgi:hypothetical protein
MDALSRFRSDRALPGWDETLTALLGEHDGARP